MNDFREEMCRDLDAAGFAKTTGAPQEMPLGCIPMDMSRIFARALNKTIVTMCFIGFAIERILILWVSLHSYATFLYILMQLP